MSCFIAQIYKWATDRFIAAQSVSIDNTRSASGLAAFTNAGTLKVAIAFFQDSASGSFATKSPVYEWRSGSFSLLQEIDTNGPVGVEYFEFSGRQYLVFANSKSTVDVYLWSGSRFNSVPDQRIPGSNVRSAIPYVIGGNGKKSVWSPEMPLCS